jgi:hypothetical protein
MPERDTVFRSPPPPPLGNITGSFHTVSFREEASQLTFLTWRPQPVLSWRGTLSCGEVSPSGGQHTEISFESPTLYVFYFSSIKETHPRMHIFTSYMLPYNIFSRQKWKVSNVNLHIRFGSSKNISLKMKLDNRFLVKGITGFLPLCLKNRKGYFKDIAHWSAGSNIFSPLHVLYSTL